MDQSASLNSSFLSYLCLLFFSSSRVYL
ncbi:hypothetical protein F383_37704 [Gossypium arboreum]|uniref:Uncharacterized protein n=1 Tax=Gossypium arboreum TaxID=29729 RepID=A0A0B0MBW6_GOSAR|nr:hypothetical protein F383_37704 [Gossypium arboreum]